MSTGSVSILYNELEHRLLQLSQEKTALVAQHADVFASQVRQQRNDVSRISLVT